MLKQKLVQVEHGPADIGEAGGAVFGLGNVLAGEIQFHLRGPAREGGQVYFAHNFIILFAGGNQLLQAAGLVREFAMQEFSVEQLDGLGELRFAGTFAGAGAGAGGLAEGF